MAKFYNTCFDWECFHHKGPAVAFHSACIIDNCLFIHGGMDKKDCTIPQNKLFKFNFSEKLWTDLTSASSPTLSHHVAVALHNRYIMLIGGWNGRCRTSKINIYDTQQNNWLLPTTKGFPSGAGLSSHTANVLLNGDIIIVGREGSLRTQRRTGNAFLLTGDICKDFEYKPHSISVSSRSGHCASIVNNNLYIVGGRDDKLIEIHEGFKSNNIFCTDMVSLELKIQQGSNTSKTPSCRKNHVMFSGQNSILLHGGETFDGRSKGPVGDISLLLLKPHLQWLSLNSLSVTRAGHVGCVNNDSIFIHGGFSNNSVAHSELFKLLLND